MEIGNDQDSLLNEIITCTREEVKQALDSLEKCGIMHMRKNGVKELKRISR